MKSRPSFRLSLLSIACASLLLQSTSAGATSLMQAYQSALQNDPQHRSAIADREAGKQYAIIGRSGLLPQIQYSFSKSRNIGEEVAPNFLGVLAPSDLNYGSESKGLTLRQPLFNMDSYARYKQGVTQSQYSEAQFDVRAKDLMVRVLGAYVDARFALDQVELYKAQRDTYSVQMSTNKRLFEKGEGTITDMLETQAKLDVSEALVIEALDNLTNAQNTLAGIVGSEVTVLDNLRENFDITKMLQDDFQTWQQIAEKNNSEIKAGQFSLESAEEEILKNRAGHLPRVDLNASYSHGRSETIQTQKQDYNQRTVGFQLVIPIYSGGYVGATTKQAISQKEKAQADLDATRTKVMVELRKEYNVVKTSIPKLDALEKSVKSANALVEATVQSIKGGIRINLDLLNAQQQLVTAKRDLAQGRYNFLTAYIKLKVAAGVAGMDDMQTIAGFFVPN